MLKKLGLFLLDWALASVWPRILSAIQTVLAKKKRAEEQKKATDKLEENVQEGKPRDEQTRKEEEEFLNS